VYQYSMSKLSRRASGPPLREYISNMYVECKDAHFFMSNDKINDMQIVPVILADEQNPILACQDRFIRVVQGSDLYYEAGGLLRILTRPTVHLLPLLHPTPAII